MTSKTGLLFDLDGTILDTDEFHFAAFDALLQKHDRCLTDDIFQQEILGRSNSEIMSNLFPDSSDQDHEDMADMKEHFFRESLPSSLSPKKGFMQILDWADEVGARTCVVTNAPRQNAETLLNALGLSDRIGPLIIGEELQHSKPSPLPYEIGLETIGADIRKSLAFEDSLPGIKSASSAGLKTFALRGSISDADLLGAGAQCAIDNYSDPKLWDCLEQISKR